MEVGTKNNFNCLLHFGWKIPSLGKSDLKSSNCMFKMKLGVQTNTNIVNSMVMLIPFDQKYSFLANLTQKIKVSVEN